jgi:primosomal protein N' (replication factor Y) (superfamily II helicase)
MPLVRVAVPIPLPREEALVYELPEEEEPRAGLRVLVPVGTRRVWGTVLGPEPRRPDFKVRAVAGLPEPRLVLTEEILDLCRWVADYYATSLGEVLQAAAPSPTGLTRRAEAAAGEERDAPWLASAPPARERLNAAQRTALDAVEAALAERAFRAFLLHGVTGSGKTAVYLHAAKTVVTQGGQSLILVPEIALSPQTLDSFRRAGFERAALYHSTLTPRDRVDVWRAVAEGALDLVVGTRSAVFLPFRDLRLAVVDEEHETAYKQEETPRYHGRDVALVRAQRRGAAVVLASATPSMESYARAKRGAYGLLSLPERIDGRPLAAVRVTDLRQRPAVTAASGLPRSPILTPLLIEAMQGALGRREQGILFLNRRGHSTYLQCRGCGHVARCRRCDVSLTLHLEEKALRCHYCGAERKLKPDCPECGAADLWFGGIGIQRVEREVRRLFPEATVARLDLDSARRRGAVGRTLREFRAGGIDFLLGTQMVAKGFDFPGVTLVGIVVADLQLYLPDFRAAERTFQLLTQVAGRAGRGESPGEVIMQSYDPEHPALRAAAAQDYEMFYAHEARERRELHYPPYGHLAEIEVRGAREERVEAAARSVRRSLGAAVGGAGDSVLVLGPAPKPLARLRGESRWHLLLRAASRTDLRALLARALPRIREAKHPGARVYIDVDPRQVL